MLSDHMFTDKCFISNKMHMCTKSNRPHVAMCNANYLTGSAFYTRVVESTIIIVLCPNAFKLNNCFYANSRPTDAVPPTV